MSRNDDMVCWYLFYYEDVAIRQQPADESLKQVLVIRHQHGDELGIPAIFESFQNWSKGIASTRRT